MSATISGIIEVLSNPNCWIQNDEFSKDYDDWFKATMPNYKFERKNDCYVTLAGVSMWAVNHPYGSFTIWANGKHYRPSRRTILTAMNKLKREIPIMSVKDKLCVESIQCG